MDNKHSRKFIDWYKTYSQEIGRNLILELHKKNEIPLVTNIENWGEIIESLYDFVVESKENSSEFSLDSYDAIIISSLPAIEKESVPDPLPVLWYGLGLQTGDYDLWESDQIIKECEAVFFGTIDNTSLLIRNIREVSKNEDAIDFCQKFVSHFIAGSTLATNNEVSWQSSLVFAIGLNVIYERLYQLSEDAQKIILQQSFYTALCGGIDVRASIQSILYNTKTVFSLVASYQRLLEILDENFEPTMIASNNFTQTLGSLWKDYLEKNKEEWSNEERLKFFCELTGKDEFQKEKIFESLKIIVDIKSAVLQQKNYGEELYESDEYRNDLIQLIFWFGIGDAGYDDLKIYFQHEEKKVSIISFIKRLIEIVDLQNMEQIENVFIFSQLLHELHWMPDDDNLLNFHESDSQFHWNEELLH